MRVMDDLYAFFWTDPSENNSNTYLITGRRNILIDPGHYHLFGHVKDELKKLSLSIQDIDLIILTHGHLDHTEAIRLFDETPAIYTIHKEEWEVIKKGSSYHMGLFGPSEMTPHILLQEGDLIVGDKRFYIIHTPGHSPGSICIYWPEKKVLFTGDCVFEQGIGRTDLLGGDGEKLKESIKRISKLEVWYVMPGHGDMIIGSDEVKQNFRQIEEFWFSLI